MTKAIEKMIYFFIALHIVAFIRVLMLKQTMIAPTTSASVAVAALVLGKAVLLAETIWPHFWALQIILFLLILIHCTTTEMARVLGKDRLLRLFLGPLPARPA